MANKRAGTHCARPFVVSTVESLDVDLDRIRQAV